MRNTESAEIICHQELLKLPLGGSPGLMKLLNGKLLLFLPSHCPQNFVPFLFNTDIYGTTNPEEAPWGTTAQILVQEIFRLRLTKPGTGAEFRRRKSWFGKCSWAGLCPQGVTRGESQSWGCSERSSSFWDDFSALQDNPPSLLAFPHFWRMLLCPIASPLPRFSISPLLLFLTLQIFEVLFFFFFDF